MLYTTTKLHPLKSYPTYQFYARACPVRSDIDVVFKACVLEALKWLRARLSDMEDMPSCLGGPLPEEPDKITDDMLQSFSFSEGPQIDAVYIPQSGVWSIRITEPDMGANIGTDRERAPVSGRSFITEIALRKQTDYVEIGMRTICSEPIDTTAGCEVFRLALVKALVARTDMRLMHGGCVINAEPLSVANRAGADRALSILTDPDRSMPIVFIAETAFEEEKSVLSVPDSMAFPSAGMSLLSRRGVYTDKMDLTISAEGIDLSKQISSKSERKDKKKSPAVRKPAAPSGKRLPSADAAKAAWRLVGFAIVMTVSEDMFPYLKNKLHISPKHGEVLIVPHQQVTESIPYETYGDDPKILPDMLYRSITESHKRCSYTFGDVLFHSDARLEDLHNKRHKTESLEDQCDIYRQELETLRSKVKEQDQQQADREQSAEKDRELNKRISTLEDELKEKTEDYEALERYVSGRDEAYRRSAELVQFYKRYIELAEQFPTVKEDICDWAEKNFGDTLIISSRARNELKKYSAPLDISCLCDGIVFLDAHVRYRRTELEAEEYELYSERRHWETGGCGKETLKRCRDDYTVTVGGKTYTLDQHIKHGIRAEDLIRIYFYWDEESRKIIIGSMPGHLPTVKNST